MTAAKKIRAGDWIKDGMHNGKVVNVRQPEVSRVLIFWSRGSTSGTMGRHPDAEVRRVYKAKRRWSW